MSPPATATLASPTVRPAVSVLMASARTGPAASVKPAADAADAVMKPRRDSDATLVRPTISCILVCMFMFKLPVGLLSFAFCCWRKAPEGNTENPLRIASNCARVIAPAGTATRRHAERVCRRSVGVGDRTGMSTCTAANYLGLTRFPRRRQMLYHAGGSITGGLDAGSCVLCARWPVDRTETRPDQGIHRRGGEELQGRSQRGDDHHRGVGKGGQGQGRRALQRHGCSEDLRSFVR